MRKILFLTFLAVLLAPSTGVTASLNNTDTQSYQLAITPTDGAFSYYTILGNAQVEVCFEGCVMTLVSSGQTIRVEASDNVVIDGGVMNVTAGD